MIDESVFFFYSSNNISHPYDSNIDVCIAMIVEMNKILLVVGSE